VRLAGVFVHIIKATFKVIAVDLHTTSDDIGNIMNFGEAITSSGKHISSLPIRNADQKEEQASARCIYDRIAFFYL
jgi:hypothetical protein